MNVLLLEPDPLWSDVYESCLPQGARPTRVSTAVKINGGYHYFLKSSDEASAPSQEVFVKIPDISAVVMGFAHVVEPPDTATGLIFDWQRSGFSAPIFIVATTPGSECRKRLDAAGIREHVTVISKDGLAPAVLTPLLRRALQS